MKLFLGDGWVILRSLDQVLLEVVGSKRCQDYPYDDAEGVMHTSHVAQGLPKAVSGAFTHMVLVI